jgi:hypothetical protein
MTYSILLGGGDLLDGKSVVEQAVAGEVLAHVLLDELNTEIRVVHALDLVADTADYKITHSSTPTHKRKRRKTRRTEFVLLPSLVDELTRSQTSITSVGEHGSSLVEGTTESATNGQKTRGQRRDEVLASTSGDDGVHGTRHGGTVVGSEHKHHLDELGGPRRET